MSATLGHGLRCLRLHSLNVDGPTLFGHLESTGVVNASVKRKRLVWPLSQINPEKELSQYILARLVSLVYLTASGRARSLDVSHECLREVVLGAGNFQA